MRATIGENGITARGRAKSMLMGKVRRIVSIATILMFAATIFQASADEACAGGSDSNPFDSSSDITPENGTSEAGPTNATPSTDTSTASPVLLDPSSIIGVQSYGSFSPTTSGFSSAPSSTTFTDKNGLITYGTSCGIYSVERSSPQFLSVRSMGAVEVVRESCFVLESTNLSTVPVNGAVLRASASTLTVFYELVDVTNKSRHVAYIETCLDFGYLDHPKITARVIQVNSTLDYSPLGWRVVWQVDPVPDMRLNVPNGTARELSALAGSAIDAPGCRAFLTLESSEGKETALQLNWSDAKAGSLAVVNHSSVSEDASYALEVSFPWNEAVIDPTVIASSSAQTPTGLSFQRTVFSYGGYYWAFYDSGIGIEYRRSPDGVSWNSPTVLACGTAIMAGSGFDVKERNGKVGVAWMEAAEDTIIVHFVPGTIMEGKINWGARVTLVNGTGPYFAPVSLAIGADGSFFVFSPWRQYPQSPYYQFSVFRSFDGVNFSDIAVDTDDFVYGLSTFTWAAIVPTSAGVLALVETNAANSSSTYARVRYWSDSEGLWTAPSEYQLGISSLSGNKSACWSVVGSTDGTIDLVYINDTYIVKCAFITPSQVSISTVYSGSDTLYPSACLDENGNLNIFFLAKVGSFYSVLHSQRYPTSWSTVDTVYAETSGPVLRGLTAWDTPIGSYATIWMCGNNVTFACTPMPYGTPGTTTDAWNRDGISPYGTYFTANGELISPGTGSLTLTSQDVSLPSRNGLILGVSRIYLQPRYFQIDDGAPWMTGGYPFCNLGQGWYLDLPWMDQNYVGIPGGQRFIIKWGNEGDSSAFVNHDGAQFTLREKSVRVHGGYLTYYELVMSSGMRYMFDQFTYRLEEISDLTEYDNDTMYAINKIWVSYDASNRISSLSEGWTGGRSIGFTYNASGSLWKVTRPDGEVFTYGYTLHNGRLYLATVTDPKNRTTSYSYSSNDCYVLNGITFPTGASNAYSYSNDSNFGGHGGTEVVSYFVVTAKVLNATGGLIRETDFDYKAVAGKIVFSRLTDKNAADAIQGWTEYIFSSALGYTNELKRNAAGTQMSRTDTWYDSIGQPVRTDTYKGSSQDISYTEYTGYDDWGNVIFTRDALGHEEYKSYGNTNTQDSFQGGGVLVRTGTGKVFHDGFDDWDASDWGTYIQNPGSTCVSLDAAANPPHAPALAVCTTSTSGLVKAYHAIGPQTGDFIWQTSFMTSGEEWAGISGMVGGWDGVEGVDFGSFEGHFYWYSGGGQEHEVAECVSNTWYDIGFSIHSTTYDIYIDGVFKTTAVRASSGIIDTIEFTPNYYASPTNKIWIDDIRIYRSLTITISNAPDYVEELLDSHGDVLARSRSGDIVLPALPISSPPGSIRMISYGDSYTETAMMDVWGGDNYSFSPRHYDSSLPQGQNGNAYAHWTSLIFDEEGPRWWQWLDGNGDGVEVTDPDYALEGSIYHESSYEASGTHFHGVYDIYNEATVYPTDTIIQYVWLTDGKMPAEIALQFLVGTTWKRAYWGEGSDMISRTLGWWYFPGQAVRIGSVPQITGSWVELTILASDLGITTPSTVGVVLYALYGGTARWDLTAVYAGDVEVLGLDAGLTAELHLDDGTVVSATSQAANQPTVLDMYGADERIFPVSGYFKVLSGTSLVYESPEITEIYHGDLFQWSTAGAPKFYPNQINGLIHDRTVGTYEYQNYSCTAPQELYVRYNSDGNPTMERSWSGAQWIFSQAGYDLYGNMVWKSDPSQTSLRNYYSSSDHYTSLAGSGPEGRLDTFDTDSSWSSSKYCPSGNTSWLTADYSDEFAESADFSASLAFSNSPGNVTGKGALWKSYPVLQPIESLSVSMYLDWYYHDSNGANSMDSGVMMRLYDSSHVNYATYTYWLSCWSGNTDNKTTQDPEHVKCIYGRPTMETWLRTVLHPSSDFPSIDWSRCVNATFEVYFNVSCANGDSFSIFFDDLAVSDSASDSDTTFTYDQYTGSLLPTTDPLGRSTTFSYDVVGRRVSTGYADGSHSSTEYDDINNTVTVYDELGHRTVNKYDSIGRLLTVERYGDGASAYSSVNYSYNWQDKVSRFTNELGYATSYSYDYLGRETKQVFPGGTSFKTVTYDDVNSTVIRTDELGHKTAQVYDDAGRLGSTWEFYTASNHSWTNMTYDPVGNLVSVRDAIGGFTNMSYDGLNRLVRTTYPDSLYEFATYDNAGRVLSKTDRNGTVTSSTYDSAGNLVKVSNPSETLIYSLDAAGQVTNVCGDQSEIEYAYNNRSWVTSIGETIQGASFDMSFGYDATGNKIWTVYPDNVNVSCTYDAFNRLIYENRTAPSPSHQLLKITYNLDDSVSTETYGQGQQEVAYYSYDQTFKRGWLGSIIIKNGSAVLSLNGYTYDAAGNVKYFTSLTGGTEGYSYDSLNRLTRAWTNTSLSFGKITYGYDAVGNRLWSNASGTNTSYSYGGYNQLEMTAAGGTAWSYQYDKNGNQVWKNGSLMRYNYQFNALNQLTQAVNWTNNSGTWTPSIVGRYYYDVNGQRAMTNESGIATCYIYVGHDPLCEKTGTTYSDYVYANGLTKVKLSGSSTYFYFDDALGSPRIVWKAGQTTPFFKVKTYKPFGAPIVMIGSEKINFAGEIRDAAAGAAPGIYYIGARWMDPELGRFVSLDPRLGMLSIPQTLDRYVYCANNPMRLTDPSGEGSWLSGAHHWWDKHWKTVLIVTAVVVVSVATAGVGAAVLAPALASTGLGEAIIGGIVVAGAAGAGINSAQYAIKADLEGKSATLGGLIGSWTEGFIQGATIFASAAALVSGDLPAAAAISTGGYEGGYLARKGIEHLFGGEPGKITPEDLEKNAVMGLAAGFTAGGLSKAIAWMTPGEESAMARFIQGVYDIGYSSLEKWFSEGGYTGAAGGPINLNGQ